MRARKEPRERSVSGDFDDSDLESQNGDARDGSNPPGRPGRKKNPNSQAARRDQNRIAQREFRLRKQQRIRDLEARVEILSGGKDEALGEMRNMLKDLMAENQTLRGLLKSLGAFIGEGAGGLLPKLGWEMSDFNQFINRSETDTAWEGYQRRKRTTTETVPGHKRSTDEDPSSLLSKKARIGDNDGDHGQNGFPLLVPLNGPPLSSNSLYAGSSRPYEGGGANTSQPYPGASMTNYQPPYIPGVNLNIEPSLARLPYYTSSNNGSVSGPSVSTQQTSLGPVGEDDNPNKAEAYKLIHYHLDNYKRNNQYCLPASLRPSSVQKSLPHESVIDAIPHPDLRDRMIILRERYDLVECLIEYRRSVTIHGDDVLAHPNWEIDEKFLRHYGFLIDQATLDISNRWRKERGEQELRLSDLGGREQMPI